MSHQTLTLAVGEDEVRFTTVPDGEVSVLIYNGSGNDIQAERPEMDFDWKVIRHDSGLLKVILNQKADEPLRVRVYY